MNDDKEFNAYHLFIRTDEKYEEVRAEMHDLLMEQTNLKNNVDRIDKRMEHGVSITGQENSRKISEHAVDIGKLKQTQELMELTITNLDKTVNDKLDKLSKAVDLIYRGILGIFFTILCGGGVLYALKFFQIR